MACEEFIKDPADTRRVIVNWSDWLGDGVNISSSAWTVATGVTEANDTNSSTTATNYFSGGTLGQTYTIKNTITTDESPARIKSVSFHLIVESNC